VAKMGRPLVQIDWKHVASLCRLQATEEEIASDLGISTDTLCRACKRENRLTFAAFFATKRLAGKISLRRAQFTRALKGSDTMMIFLGKQILDQKDVRVNELRTEKPVVNIKFEVVDGPATGDQTGAVPPDQI